MLPRRGPSQAAGGTPGEGHPDRRELRLSSIGLRLCCTAAVPSARDSDGSRTGQATRENGPRGSVSPPPRATAALHQPSAPLEAALGPREVRGARRASAAPASGRPADGRYRGRSGGRSPAGPGLGHGPRAPRPSTSGRPPGDAAGLEHSHHAATRPRSSAAEEHPRSDVSARRAEAVRELPASRRLRRIRAQPGGARRRPGVGGQCGRGRQRAGERQVREPEAGPAAASGAVGSGGE